MTFGEKLKQLRTAKEMTGEALAKEIGVSVNTYRNYEQNRSKPAKAEVLEALANVLGVTVRELTDVDANAPVKRESSRKKSRVQKAVAWKTGGTGRTGGLPAASPDLDAQIAAKEQELADLYEQKKQAEYKDLIEQYYDVLTTIKETGLTKAQANKAIKDAAKARRKGHKPKKSTPAKAKPESAVLKNPNLNRQS